VEKGWFRRARAQWFETPDDLARACDVSVDLIHWLEAGSVTAPELAKRIGKALGLTKEQVDAITCQESVQRRKAEKRLRPEDKMAMCWH
jgi:predicted transcriptional regulator